MPHPQKRIVWLDYAKCLAIALLILWHYPTIWQDNDMLTLEKVRFICTFLMPFFFITSGMLHKEEPSAAQAAHKCFIRLLLPYLAYCLISGAVCLSLHPGWKMSLSLVLTTCSGFDCPIFIRQYLHLPFPDLRLGPLWFVYSLICIKMCMAGAEALKRRHRHAGHALIAVFVLLCLAATWHTQKVGHVLGFRIQSTAVGALFYLIGYFGRNAVKTLLILPRKSILLCTIPALIGAIGGSVWCIGWGGHYTLSINACRLGESVIALFICGISGSLLLMMCCRLLPQVESAFIQVYSNGTLFILAVHQSIWAAMKAYLPLVPGIDVALAATLFQMLLFYPLLRLAYAYCPLLLGFRKNN